jgi:hypothetical protein
MPDGQSEPHGPGTSHNLTLATADVAGATTSEMQLDRACRTMAEGAGHRRRSALPSAEPDLL